jgi:hypothetical protein
MSNKKLKAKKAKAKERATEAQKHKQRLFAMREKRAERAREKLERQFRDRQEPIRTNHLAKIEEGLENNLEVLKALEQEYIEAQKAKENLHEELEAEGFNSIEEKVEALKQKSAEMVEKIQADVENDKLPEDVADEIMPIIATVSKKNEQSKKTD